MHSRKRMGESTNYTIAIMMKHCPCWRKHIWHLTHLSYLFETNLGVLYTAENTYISHWGSQWICPEECSDTDGCWAYWPWVVWMTRKPIAGEGQQCTKFSIFKQELFYSDRVHEVQERSLTLPDRAPSRTSNPSETVMYNSPRCVNWWVSKDDTHFLLLSHTFR